MTKWLRGWEFDEMEEKSSPTKKQNSYPKRVEKYNQLLLLKRISVRQPSLREKMPL